MIARNKRSKGDNSILSWTFLSYCTADQWQRTH